MDLFFFSSFMAVLTLAIFILHILRHRTGQGLFVSYVAFLWFLAFLTGALNYRIKIEILNIEVAFRYSSAIFTLIFVAILLVYICEGIRESRTLIVVSILMQFFLVFAQLFLYYLAGKLLSADSESAAASIFQPRYFRLTVAILAAIVDLFFAIAFFQLLVNYLKKAPLGLLIFIALLATMMLDSLLYVGLTGMESLIRPEVSQPSFADTILSHAIFKSLIVFFVSGPFALYIRWFQKKSHLNLNRGSLDIFKKIENLQEDLRKANEELRQYADRLEIMVEERTQQIREKQAQIEYELAMAADVQKAMLPEAGRIKSLPYATRFLPCSSVSGDLYDLGQLDDENVFIFLADISGHGMPSALIGAMTKMAMSRINLRSTMPGAVLSRLSKTIEKVTDFHYLTGILLNINIKNRELTYASGAHVPAALVTGAGQITMLEPTGSIIGSALSSEFGMRRARYNTDVRLVVYTDCALEHKNQAREEFGMLRFQEILKETRALAPEDALNSIQEQVFAFGGRQPFTDDFTMVLVDLP